MPIDPTLGVGSATAKRVLGVVVTVMVAHGSVLLAPFQFDDLHQIVSNPAFRDPASAGRFFIDPWVGSSLGHVFFYRPLLFLTFLMDGMAGGGSPMPYRITSLAILVVLALLVGRLAALLLPSITGSADSRRLRQASLMVSLVIAVHPLVNESLLLASGRSSLLMATFGSGALCALATRESPAGRRTATAAIVTVLALLTKETAVVLLPLALLVQWLTSRNEHGVRHILRAWPVVVPVLVYTVLYVGATKGGWFFPPAPVTAPGALGNPSDLIDRSAVGLVSLGRLGSMVLVPVGLSLVHPAPAISAPLRVLAPIAWMGCMLGCVLLLRSGGVRWRLLGFAFAWFVCALGPIVTAGLHTPMAEHRLVLALAGPATAIGWALTSLRPPRVRLVAGLTTLSALAVLSQIQAWPWRSPITLWEHETARYPRSDRAWSFLAMAYAAGGKLDRAEDAIARALALAPRNVTHLGQAAGFAMQRGELDAAGRYTAAVLAIETAYLPVLLVETERLALLGQLPEARAIAERAVRAAPQSSAAWNALGNVQLMAGDARAAEAYRRALELDPSNVEAAQNLRMAIEQWDN